MLALDDSGGAKMIFVPHLDVPRSATDAGVRGAAITDKARG